MKPVAQVAGVVLGACVGATAMATVVGMVASAQSVCDPKFGCTLGVQFGALIACGVGLILGLALLGAFGAYASFSARAVPVRVMWSVALAAGMASGAALSIGALVSYT